MQKSLSSESVDIWKEQKSISYSRLPSGRTIVVKSAWSELRCGHAVAVTQKYKPALKAPCFITAIP